MMRQKSLWHTIHNMTSLSVCRLVAPLIPLLFDSSSSSSSSVDRQNTDHTLTTDWLVIISANNESILSRGYDQANQWDTCCWAGLCDTTVVRKEIRTGWTAVTRCWSDGRHSGHASGTRTTNDGKWAEKTSKSAAQNTISAAGSGSDGQEEATRRTDASTGKHAVRNGIETVGLVWNESSNWCYWEIDRRRDPEVRRDEERGKNPSEEVWSDDQTSHPQTDRWMRTGSHSCNVTQVHIYLLF